MRRVLLGCALGCVYVRMLPSEIGCDVAWRVVMRYDVGLVLLVWCVIVCS